jgi:hypothetical protein
MQFLPKLRAHAHNNWQILVTEDESWFYDDYVRDRIWTSQDENTPEIANRTTASGKSMLTALWNPNGYHVVIMLPPSASFNASWFVGQSLVPLRDRFFPGGWDGRRKGWSSILTMQQSPRKRFSQPPSSLDISTSDFCRFGKVKNTLIGQEIPDGLGLFEIMTVILDGISGNELQAVFRNWIEHVQGVIHANVAHLSW